MEKTLFSTPELAEWLNQEGHDAVHAFQSGLGE